MSADVQVLQSLQATLDQSAAKLRQVTAKKMFGCHALFANSHVFALVWKHGQIGIKLTHESDYKKLLAIKGAGPWKAGAMQMSHWVLVPPSLEKSSAALRPWLVLAHAQALASLPKKSPVLKKSKKPVSKAK